MKAHPVDPARQAFIDSINREVRRFSGVPYGVLGTKGRRRLPKIRRKAAHLIEVALSFAELNPRYQPLDVDMADLRQAEKDLYALLKLQTALQGAAVQAADGARKLESMLWTMAMKIYAIAKAYGATDHHAKGFLEIMRGTLKLGPRNQTSVAVEVEPIPRSKRGVRKALLAEARRKRGLPSSKG